MAGLQEQARWENEIYRIEENDPVHGGENGITNKPIKQLANRTKYLKQELDKRAGTAQVGRTQLTNDTGLDSETLALTAKAGKALAKRIAQNQQAIAGLNSGKVDKTAISNSVSSTSQTNVASSQAVKTAYDKGVEAKNAADAAQRTANSKLGNTGDQTLNDGVLSIVNNGWTKLSFSTSQQNRYGRWELQTNMHGLEHQTHFFRARLMHDKDNVRTFTDFPYAEGNQVVAYQSWVKEAISTFKIPLKSGSTAVELDLSRRSQIIREIGDAYRGVGRYYLTFHNTQAQHRITNLPLGGQRGSIEIVVSVMEGYSFLECYYLGINRRFFSSVNWNEENLTLRWQEMLTNSHDGKTVLRHNATQSQPAMHFLDEATNLDAEITQRKIISNIEYRVAKDNQPNGEVIAVNRIHLLPSKQSEIEVAGKNSERQWVRYLTHFSSNGATNLGGATNNGRDRLQVSGTASATAPASTANNDQLPTTAWVRQFAASHLVNNLTTNDSTKALTAKQGMELKKLIQQVNRRDYSRRISGTAPGQTQNQMDVVGSVHIYPDGRIVQILHLKHFRDLWFGLEDVSVGYGGGNRGRQIPLQLWTAMPNKVLSVQAQLVRATHPTSSTTFEGGEAAEHVCAWDLRKQGTSRDRVTINTSRFRGGESEHIDMYVVVEGY